MDVDGVLNCASSGFENNGWIIDHDKMVLLKRIVNETGCTIVLSSSWRLMKTGIDLLSQSLEKFSIPFDSVKCVTPCLGDLPRSHEILEFKRSISHEGAYAIVDDSGDAFIGIPNECAFKTSFKTGLTEEITTNIINWLNN